MRKSIEVVYRSKPLLDDNFFVIHLFGKLLKRQRASSVAPGTIIIFITLEVVCMEGQNMNEICSENCGSPDLEKTTPDLQPFFYWRDFAQICQNKNQKF
jgi:hypothetical protein